MPPHLPNYSSQYCLKLTPRRSINTSHSSWAWSLLHYIPGNTQEIKSSRDWHYSYTLKKQRYSINPDKANKLKVFQPSMLWAILD